MVPPLRRSDKWGDSQRARRGAGCCLEKNSLGFIDSSLRGLEIFTFTTGRRYGACNSICGSRRYMSEGAMETPWQHRHLNFWNGIDGLFVVHCQVCQGSHQEHF